MGNKLPKEVPLQDIDLTPVKSFRSNNKGSLGSTDRAQLLSFFRELQLNIDQNRADFENDDETTNTSWYFNNHPDLKKILNGREYPKYSAEVETFFETLSIEDLKKINEVL